MATAIFTPFYCLAADMPNKVHNLASDTLKVFLTAEAPVLTDTVKTDMAEIASGNGYTTGGTTISVTSSTQSSGVYKLVLGDATWTASGGNIAAFRYAVLYNDTATARTDPVIGYWDYGASLTVTDGEPLTLDLDGTNGIFTYSVA
ncbi:hypothetical protein [Caudoviricetes sp.]|nr:hypothetical protein [Caudoviricetes sp.]